MTALSLVFAGCDGKEDNPADQGGTSGSSEDPDDDDTSDPEDPEDDDDPGQTTGADDEPEDEEDTDEEPEDTDDGCTFLCDDPDNPSVAECDLWTQDCDTGEKCMPWANDGGSSWNASKCTMEDSEPGQPGDACTVEGSGVSGVDSCAVGSMCWDVDEENNGTCVAFCGGSAEAAICDDPTTSCIIANDGFLPLCLTVCDPLLQDCGDGSACYPGDDGFVCVPDASGPDLGAFGDPCEFTNACDPGLLCAGAAAVPGCESARCCTDFCDLSDPEPAVGCGGLAGGQECVGIFPEGQAPPGSEDTGFCAIPE
ncbi:MAG: ribulose phosphate epimerase [Myxococcota bacterium]